MKHRASNPWRFLLGKPRVKTQREKRTFRFSIRKDPFTPTPELMWLVGSLLSQRKLKGAN